MGMGCVTAGGAIRNDEEERFENRLIDQLNGIGLKCARDSDNDPSCRGENMYSSWFDYDESGRRLVVNMGFASKDECSTLGEVLHRCNSEYNVAIFSCADRPEGSEDMVVAQTSTLVPDAGFKPEEISRFLGWLSFHLPKVATGCGLMEHLK